MISYKDAGVNKEEGYRAVDKIKDAAKSTHSANVLTGLGSFGSMYALGQYKDPVLVSGTDGVGTKLEVAIKTKNYDTVGQDCVAMVVNDILCHGAKPMFFLDYLACGRLDSDVSSRLVIGMANACKETETALVGGETAEMPGFYKEGDYDIAGFAVGVVERDEIITGDKIKEGDVIVALKSNGLHSNGFSLVRKLVPDFNVEFEGAPIHEELLKPTRLYVKPVLDLLKEVEVSGIAHITGGGLEENVPRIIPNGLQADIKLADVKVLPIFKYLASKGVNEHEMFGTFNMGVGMVIVVDKSLAEKTVDSLNAKGEDAYIIGEIKKGDTKICLK
jgi:phosphoribosylformylglycinamidine cyclo-ligase